MLNLEEEVWWCLAWFLLLVQNLLSGYTVKSMHLYTKRYWRNMYLIWGLQLINQLYLYKITLRVTHQSQFRHFFLRRMLLLLSGLLKAQTWILLNRGLSWKFWWLRNANRVKIIEKCVKCTEKYVLVKKIFKNGLNMGLPLWAQVEKTVYWMETLTLC